MKSMATFWDDVWFLAWETKAKTKRLEADGAFVLDLFEVITGDDWHRSDVHGGERMNDGKIIAAGGVGGVGRADGGRELLAEDGVKCLEGRFCICGRLRGSTGGGESWYERKLET